MGWSSYFARGRKAHRLLLLLAGLALWAFASSRDPLTALEPAFFALSATSPDAQADVTARYVGATAPSGIGGRHPLKQLIRVRNRAARSRSVPLRLRQRIRATRVVHGGRDWALPSAASALRLQGPSQALAFAIDGGRRWARYDWSDVAAFAPQLWAWREGAEAVLELRLLVPVAAGASREIDPVFDLASPSNYNLRFDGPANGSRLAQAAVSGDFNGDGYADLALGAPAASTAGRSSNGAVWIRYGPLPAGPGSALDLSSAADFAVRFDGAEDNGDLGQALAAADLNGDGLSDLVLSDPASNLAGAGAGAVYVVYGGSANFPAGAGATRDLASGASFNVRLDGSAALGLGKALGAADFNADGIADLAMGAPAAGFNSRAGSGSVYLVGGPLAAGSGQVLDLSSAANYQARFDGAAAADGLGQALASGDLNWDGISDLVLGAQGASNNSRTGSGSAFLRYGPQPLGPGLSVDLAAGSAFNVRIDGAVAGDALGASLASGDLDHDGAPDLALGAALASGLARSGSGSVYTVMGPLAAGTGQLRDLSNTAMYAASFVGAFAGDQAGWQLLASDADGDGRCDLSIGAPGFSSGTAGGAAYLASNPLPLGPGAGRDLGLSNDYGSRFDGATAAGRAGEGFAAGDLNGDGRGDWVLLAPLNDSAARTDNGTVYGLFSPSTAFPGPVLSTPTPSPTPGGLYSLLDQVVTNGAVHALTASAGTLYLGGDFTRLGRRSGPAVAWDLAGNTPLAAWPAFADGSVAAVIPDGAGGWYVGGSFKAVAGQPRAYLVRVLSNGVLDPTFAPAPDGEVRCLDLAGASLFAGGSFSVIGGLSRPNFAKLDAFLGSAIPAMNATVDGTVRSLVRAGRGVFLGGDFSAAGGQSRSRLAKVDALSGAADLAFDPAPNGAVEALLLKGNALLVGGQFSTLAGQARSRLGKLDRDSGALDLAFDPAPDGSVLALKAWGQSLFVAGAFANIGGQPVARLAKVDADSGVVDLTFAPAPGGSVNALALAGRSLYLGGAFLTVTAQAHEHLAKVDADSGALDSAFGLGANGDVAALEVAGGLLLAGGAFTSLGTLSVRERLAAVDLVTGAISPWAPGANATVRALALVPAGVAAGGDFSSAGGAARAGLAVLDAGSGTALPGFRCDSDGSVLSLLASGADLYVAGAFNSLSGVPRTGLAKVLAADGTVDPAFDAGVNGPVAALALPPAGLMLAGSFTQVSGGSRPYLARVNSLNGALDPTFDAAPNSTVAALAWSGGELYAGGLFTLIGGQARSYAARLALASGAADPAFNAACNAAVQALAQMGADLYLGGVFSSAGGQSRARLAKVSAGTGTADLLFNAPANGSLRALGLSGDGQFLFAGGDFSALLSQPAQGYAVLRVLLGPATPTFTVVPTETATATASASPSATPTATTTHTPSATPTDSPTATPSATPSATPTASPTATPSASPSATPTASPTATATHTPSASPTATGTHSPSATATWTPTATPTVTATVTETISPSSTLSRSATSTPTPSPSATLTPSFSVSPTQTPYLSPTPTATPAPRPEGSAYLSVNLFEPLRARPLLIEAGPPADGVLRITVYNLLGERVLTVHDGLVSRGQRFAITWDGRNDSGQVLASGTYFITFECGDWKQVRRLKVLR